MSQDRPWRDRRDLLGILSFDPRPSPLVPFRLYVPASMDQEQLNGWQAAHIRQIASA